MSSSTLVFTWPAMTNQRVTGYDVYFGTVHVGPTTFTKAEFRNLECGKTYVLRLIAFNATGGKSIPTVTYAKMGPCPSSPAAPPGPKPGKGESPGSVPSPPPSSPGGSSPPPSGGGSSSTPPPGGALAVARGGSDKNSCAAAAPCATFNRAYQQASPGQTVVVGSGSYPAQKILVDSRKLSASADVVFQPVAGGQVRVAGVAIFGSHLELRNMQTAWHVQAGANGVTLRNVIADGAVYISGASNVSVLGGQVYSPVPVASDSQIASIQGKVPTNILIDGVAFHDFQDIGPGALHHIECLQVGSAINLTIRNSSFRNCATHDIFIRSWGTVNNSPYPLSNILIQNNSFAATTSGYYVMQVMDDLWTGSPRTSVSILNNTAQQNIVVRVTNGTAKVWNNYLPSMSAYQCNAYGQNAWFNYNTYAIGVPCGAQDIVLRGSPLPITGRTGGRTAPSVG